MLGGIASNKDFGMALEVGALRAAAAVNATAQTSVSFDRAEQGPALSHHLTAIVGFAPSTFGGADTLGLTLLLQESDDDTNWGSAPAELQPVAALSITGPQTTGAVALVRRYDVKLGGCKRYVRFAVTPALGGSCAGTLILAGIYGGDVKQPAYAEAATDFVPSYKA